MRTHTIGMHVAPPIHFSLSTQPFISLSVRVRARVWPTCTITAAVLSAQRGFRLDTIRRYSSIASTVSGYLVVGVVVDA